MYYAHNKWHTNMCEIAMQNQFTPNKLPVLPNITRCLVTLLGFMCTLTLCSCDAACKSRCLQFALTQCSVLCWILFLRIKFSPFHQSTRVSLHFILQSLPTPVVILHKTMNNLFSDLEKQSFLCRQYACLIIFNKFLILLFLISGFLQSTYSHSKSNADLFTGCNCKKDN